MGILRCVRQVAAGLVYCRGDCPLLTMLMLSYVPLCRYGMVNTRGLPADESLRAPIQVLLLSTKHDPARTCFTAQWRCFTVISPGGGLLGPPLSKLDKLLAALRWQCSYVHDSAAVQEWLQMLCKDIEVCGMLPAYGTDHIIESLEGACWLSPTAVLYMNIYIDLLCYVLSIKCFDCYLG